MNASLLKKEVYSLNEKEEEKYWYNHKLKGKYTGILVVVLVTTFIVHQAATTIWGPFPIMEGTTFNDYECFVEFMEQDIKAEPKEQFAGGTIAIDQAAPEEAIPGTTIYYDRYGNEISEEEALHLLQYIHMMNWTRRGKSLQCDMYYLQECRPAGGGYLLCEYSKNLLDFF